MGTVVELAKTCGEFENSILLILLQTLTCTMCLMYHCTKLSAVSQRKQPMCSQLSFSCRRRQCEILLEDVYFKHTRAAWKMDPCPSLQSLLHQTDA